MICKLFASLYILSVILISHYEWGAKYNKIIAASFLAVVIIERLLSKKNLLEIIPQHIFFLFWLAIATFAGLLSNLGTDVLKSSMTTLLVFLVSIPIFMVIVDRHCLRLVIWTLVLAAIASNALITFGIFPISDSGDRFAGTLGNANLFAFVSLIGLTGLTYLWKVHHHRLVKVLLFLAGILLSFQIIIAGSRKGILGVFLILLIQYVFFVLKHRKKGIFKRLAGGLIALSILFGVFSYLVMTSDASYRMRNIMHFVKGEKLEKGEGSITGRSYLLAIGINEFFENPVIGSGLSSFSKIRVGYGVRARPISAYAHSNLVEVLVSSGAFGFVLYYAIYLACILQLLRYYKLEIDDSLEPLLYFATTAIAILFLYELLAVTYYGKEFWILLSCVLGSLTILDREPLSSQNREDISR